MAKLTKRQQKMQELLEGFEQPATIPAAIEKLQEINNLITALNVSSTGKLKQIGVQSAPGFLMSIDGEPVRVGRTGMYEINYGVSISYLGFVINDDKTQFLLDYQY